MGMWWGGVTQTYDSADHSDLLGDLVFDIPLNQIRINNGDQVARLLVEYSFYSDLHENSVAMNHSPEPWCLAVTFTPNPDGPPDLDIVEPQGALQSDALYTTMLRWKPARWTDGTTNSTQWYADSNGVESVQGTRTIHNKADANLHFGIQGLGDEIGPLDYVPLILSGWIHIKYLIKPIFG